MGRLLLGLCLEGDGLVVVWGWKGGAKVFLTCCQQAAENESNHGAEEVFAAVGFALAFGGFGPLPGSLLLAFGAFLFAEGG